MAVMSAAAADYFKARQAYNNAVNASKQVHKGDFADFVSLANSSSKVEDVHSTVASAVKNSGLTGITNVSHHLAISQVAATSSFTDVFKKLTSDRIKKIKKSEEQTAAAIAGNADVIEVMAAVKESEVALKELVAIRDKIIGAYQEVLRMSL